MSFFFCFFFLISLSLFSFLKLKTNIYLSCTGQRGGPRRTVTSHSNFTLLLNPQSPYLIYVMAKQDQEKNEEYANISLRRVFCKELKTIDISNPILYNKSLHLVCYIFEHRN